MTITATPVRCNLAVDNAIVEQIMEVSCLGVTITTYGDVYKRQHQMHSFERYLITFILWDYDVTKYENMFFQFN